MRPSLADQFPECLGSHLSRVRVTMHRISGLRLAPSPNKFHIHTYKVVPI